MTTRSGVKAGAGTSGAPGGKIGQAQRPQAAADEPQRVTAVWNTRVLGRWPGDCEELVLTDLVRTAASDGRITLLDEDGQPVPVARPPRAVRQARPRAARPERPQAQRIVRKG